MKKTLLIPSLMLCPVLLAACNGIPGYYRTPTVQGNVLEPKKVKQVKLGMSRRQVHYLLGTPLVAPKFQPDREAYVFYYRNPRAHTHRSKLVLYYSHDKLSRVSGSKEFTSEILNHSHKRSSNKS